MHYQCTEHSNSSDSDELYFYYDSNGYLTGIEYNDVNYYPATNRRGDVLAIYKNTGECIARYEYDAWGNVISVIDCDYYDETEDKIIEKDITNDTSSTDIAMVNPIRYRGYYYDVETKFYYLQSRYYNPEVCRFLNGDSQLNQQSGPLGFNMFAYAENNPIMFSDPTGHSIILACLIGGAIIGAITGGAIGASVSKIETGKVSAKSVVVGALAGAVIGGAVGAAMGAVGQKIATKVASKGVSNVTQTIGKGTQNPKVRMAAERGKRQARQGTVLCLDKIKGIWYAGKG